MKTFMATSQPMKKRKRFAKTWEDCVAMAGWKKKAPKRRRRVAAR